MSVFSRFRAASEGPVGAVDTNQSPPPTSRRSPPLIAIPEGRQPMPHVSSFPGAAPRSRNPSMSPPASHDRARSRSPSASRRTSSSFGNGKGGLQSFPTPFHQFKLNPNSTRNQVNALKFIDRIDSLLFLGHSGSTVLEAVAACMTNPDSQAWFQRTQSDIHRPSTIEEFRNRIIDDHVWAFEQSRIMSRYQSRNAAINGRRDPYLDSAEFKLHLGYIREVVKLEESLAHRERKLALVNAEIQSLHAREASFQMTIANLQNDISEREGGQPVPVAQRTNDLINNMREMEEGKLLAQSLEQEKSTLKQHIGSIQMQLEDLGSRNKQLQLAADSATPMKARLTELEAKVSLFQAGESTLKAKIADLTAKNLELQQQASTARSPPATSPSQPQLEFELQQMQKHQQYLITELTARDKTILDMEAEMAGLKSRSVSPPQGTTPYPMGGTDATRTIDNAFAKMNMSNANLEALIQQKDGTIFELHSKLGRLTDEAIARIQRVFQVEQSLLDSQSLSRAKDTQIFTLEARLLTLGHGKDCACGACSLSSNSSSAVSENYSNRTASWASNSTNNTSNSAHSISGQATPRSNMLPTNVSSTSVASITSTPSHPRFLDIKFKYQNLHPMFLPTSVQMQTAQLLENGLTVMHPGEEFKMLWETIARGLLETLNGDASVLGSLTTHMKLCFREREGESLKGLVVADVWNEVWKDVSGLDVVCDF